MNHRGCTFSVVAACAFAPTFATRNIRQTTRTGCRATQTCSSSGQNTQSPVVRAYATATAGVSPETILSTPERVRPERVGPWESMQCICNSFVPEKNIYHKLSHDVTSWSGNQRGCISAVLRIHCCCTSKYDTWYIAVFNHRIADF